VAAVRYSFGRPARNPYPLSTTDAASNTATKRRRHTIFSRRL
jgi:hypothetical protein